MTESVQTGVRRRKRRRTVLSIVLLGVSLLIFGLGLLTLILLNSGRYGTGIDDILDYVFAMLLVINVLVGWVLMLASTAMGAEQSHSVEHDLLRKRLIVIRNRLFPAILMLNAIRILAILVFIVGSTLIRSNPLNRFISVLNGNLFAHTLLLSASVILVLYHASAGPWMRTAANLRFGAWIAASAERAEKPWRAVASRLMLHTFGLFSLIWAFAVIGLLYLTLTDPFWQTPTNWPLLNQPASTLGELALWGSVVLLMFLHSVGQGIITWGTRLLSTRKQQDSGA